MSSQADELIGSKPVPKTLPMTTQNKPTTTVAIIYATQGGMGDVGKFAILQASQAQKINPNLRFRAIAMSDEELEGTDLGISVDVTDEKLKTEVAGAFDGLDVIKVNADDEKQQLGEALEGVDVVIACLGNRQPSMARWCHRGARSVVSAMEANNVPRLILLSSMGIGQDFTPLRNKRFWVRWLWNGLLRTLVRSAWKDLIAMEALVTASKLDYLLVRPVGLTPEEPPVDTWHLLTSPDDDMQGGGPGLSISVAKADVASFLWAEAITPTFHGRGVTIGQVPS